MELQTQRRSWQILRPKRQIGGRVNFNVNADVDSSSNVMDAFRASDLYHSILSMTWRGFFLLVVLSYLGVNLIFAGLYFACGPTALLGVENLDFSHRFLECFFFSVQTLATIGYGRINPVGILPNILVSMEALVGLLGLALATGLLFSRFSRATAKVIFSRVAVVNQVDGVPCLIFRMANERANQIIEAQVSVSLLRQEKTSEGETYRNFYDLKLERTRSPMFMLTWTIVHPIDPESPLYGMTQEKLAEVQGEVIVNLQGLDETFGEMIHDRYSYRPEEIIWGAKFQDVLSRSPEGSVSIDMASFHRWKELS